jgi:hypothetical protein
MRHEHFVRREIVVERQRRSVFDAFRDGILVQVTFVVFATERLKRPFAISRFIYRRASESNERRIRQPGHQEVPKIAGCCPMSLVD